MRYLSFVLLMLFPPLVHAGGLMTPRPADPLAAEFLAQALEQSAVVRSLVATLERSNVIVHIETSRALPDGLGGMTRFVTSRGGYRYLRITIHAALKGRARNAILGHELRHACEVAESSADDVASLRRLFEHTGHRYGNYYETRAAMEVERTIRTELSAGARSLQAEPVVKFDH